MGPMLESFVYVERFQQKMYVVECECAHGAQIDNAFGYFVEVKNPGNTNKSRLTIYFTPTFTGDTPTFAVLTKRVRPYSEYICAATITTQVVPSATLANSDATTWESTVEPIDDYHSLLTIVTPTEFAALTIQEWDESLNLYVEITAELTTAGGASSIANGTGADLGKAIHISYKQLKCGWYLKTTEKFDLLDRTYITAVDFYWPGVLTDLFEYVYTKKDVFDKEGNEVSGGFDTFIEPILGKEAYRGPCKAEVREVFSLSEHTITKPNVMMPIPVAVTTPWASFSVGPTLHGIVTFDVDISDDPVYSAVSASYSWPATTPTDWPAFIVASDTQEPVRGGWMRRLVTVYPPDYTP